MTNKEAAIALASERLIVFPCYDRDTVTGKDKDGKEIVLKEKSPKVKWADIAYREAWAIRVSWNDNDLPAIPVGKHGIVVIDCDVAKGDKPDGRVMFDELCKRESLDRRAWFVVMTPSGGYHYYFRTDVQFTTCIQSPLPGTDTRAVGGYVIGPGAVNSEGRSYQIVNGTWDAIPELPDVLARLLRVKGAEVSPTRPGPVSEAPLPIHTEGDSAYARGALASACAAIRSASEGERNDTLNIQSLGIAEIAANVPSELEAIGGALLQAALDSGLGDDESRKTIASAFKKGLKQRREMPSEKQVPMPEGGLFSAMTLNSASEAPRPLRRESASGEVFPLDALGHGLSHAALAIADKIQCPVGMAALSVLGAASLAVQAHADVRLPASTQVKPLSLFLVSIGESGERKSAADGEALKAIRQREKELSASYALALNVHRDIRDAWEATRIKILKGKNDSPHAIAAALATLGPEPIAPLTPILTCPEPTFEGLCNLYQTGYPALGLFSDEGGQFVGGHALSADSRLRTIAGLSKLWDGAPIVRVRAAKDSSFVLPGRRLAMHLMLQPGVAASLLSDPILKDQGFLSRLLVSQPPTMTGTRFQRPLQHDTEATLDKYTRHLHSILIYPPRMTAGKTNELEPRALDLDDAARSCWNDYADSVERQLGLGGKYESIKRFAGKLPEHATRIAGVLALFEDIACPFITAQNLERGIMIANHFAEEALRLFDASAVTVEIALAEKLLEWLQFKWTETFVGLSSIYQYGPNGIRDARTARTVVAVLVDHGWLLKAPAGTLINGKPTKESWQVVKLTA